MKEKKPLFRLVKTTGFYKKEGKFGTLTHTAGNSEQLQYWDEDNGYVDVPVEHVYMDLK